MALGLASFPCIEFRLLVVVTWDQVECLELPSVVGFAVLVSVFLVESVVELPVD